MVLVILFRLMSIIRHLSFSSWKYIYFLQHSKALRRIAYHLFLPHWFISLARCQHTSGNWNLHPSIYWQSVFSNLLSLLSLSLVRCQQTAGKFKSTIIDLLTTNIFLESVLQMLIQNALIVSCTEICLGHLASETSLLAKIKS